MRVEAAVMWRRPGDGGGEEGEEEERVAFLSGSRPVLYDWRLGTQDNLGSVAGIFFFPFGA